MVEKLNQLPGVIQLVDYGNRIQKNGTYLQGSNFNKCMPFRVNSLGVTLL